MAKPTVKYDITPLEFEEVKPILFCALYAKKLTENDFIQLYKYFFENKPMAECANDLELGRQGFRVRINTVDKYVGMLREYKATYPNVNK